MDIEIEVINWAKHQRKDVKKPSWFALNNRILEDAKLFDLADGEWKSLIYIFCQASQQCSSASVRLNFAHAKRVCDIPEKKLRSALEKLANAGVTRTLRGRDMDVTRTSLHRTGQDKTLQDKTNTIAHPDGFAEFWSGYPRKVGKGKAEKAYRAAIKSGADSKDLLVARDKYREYVKSKSTEARYIKHGSTFMAEWRDWLDPETGQAEDFSRPEGAMTDAEYAEREAAIFREAQ